MSLNNAVQAIFYGLGGKKMSETIRALKQRIDELENENRELKAENEELKERNLDLEASV